MPWFLDRIDRGTFIITNPFNRKTKIVDATPKAVHTIVFWSKNFGPFFEMGAHKILKEKGYNLFFNFTINTPVPELEPELPDLEDRLNQMARLADAFDPNQINWRFDPICFYERDGCTMTNLDSFESITDRLSGIGIKRCITSFYDPYKKVDVRLARLFPHGKLKLIDPNTVTKSQVIEDMANTLIKKRISLSLCCEKELIDQAGLSTKVQSSACIDGRLYKKLFGGNPEIAGDYGQRRKKGCQCTKSVDVGAYDHHPCPHNCLFCYARTEFDTRKKTKQI